MNLGCRVRVSRTQLVESGSELTNCSHSPVPLDLRRLRAILGASTGSYLAVGFRAEGEVLSQTETNAVPDLSAKESRFRKQQKSL